MGHCSLELFQGTIIMIQLFLFRHAKTEEAGLLGLDFKRNLKERGKSDAKKISQYLDEHHKHPQLVLCSTANRTMQTCEIYLQTVDFQGEVVHLENLYHASSSGILDIIKEHQGSHERIMVIGHNMGISQLANMLCTSGCEELPTAGVAIIQFESDIEPYAGKLEAYITPKDI
jgi:phosphohistidine phosphatase